MISVLSSHTANKFIPKCEHSCLFRCCMYDNLYPVQTVPQSPGGAESEPKDGEEEVVYTAAITDKEIFYSSLEGPDWKDLPSFAYQISQGMVCS